MKLDFSEFHDGFHTIWQCSGYPGGRRRHLSNYWHYHPGGRARYRRWFYCWWGGHEWAVWFKAQKVHGVYCHSCPAEANNAQRNEAIVKERNRSSERPLPEFIGPIQDWGDV